MEDYKKAAVLENQFEAQLLASILSERGIPHRLQTYHDTAFDGLFQTQKGWGYVGAPEKNHSEIKEILDDLRRNSPGELVDNPEPP
ncbi:MAG: hypothetical protein HN366_14010 [Deltaproteobacteria bacterium]|jgi:hypothetical protein|nr:hypothetical protein [Deltaproteobacteria bacterium]